ncbi:MAG TPA: DinB family protein [Trueperaceae bacterium]|nr:DinB family protein [Trueperaceae bacterium]
MSDGTRVLADETDGVVHVGLIRSVLKSQYHAGLAMLRQTIELCPEELWFDAAPRNSFWQVAYHALFFTHLYLMPREEDFVPWEGHVGEVQNPDGIAGPPDPDSPLPVTAPPYSRAQALAYLQHLDGMIDDVVDSLDLASADSGFYWYKVPKLEHQLINVRHLNHHMAQLADRLTAAGVEGVRWVGARRPG